MVFILRACIVNIMKRCGKMAFCLAGIVALSPTVQAAVNDSAPPPPPETTSETTSDQPYSAIWVRNVFDLKPTPPPPANTPPPAPPANVHLMGITTLFGTKKAILSVQPGNVPGKPPAQKEDSYSMTEGERHGGLEVLEIDPKNRTVKIKNDELVSTITFETNKPSAAPPPAMAGGVAPPVFGRPAGVPMPLGTSTPLPPRTVRSSPDYTQGASTQPTYAPGFQPTSAVNYAGAGNTGAAGLNLGNLFSQQQSVQNNPPPPEVPLEVTGAQMILQTQQLKNQGFQPPPLPPVFDLSGMNGADAATENTTTPTQSPVRNPHARVTGNFNIPLPPGVPGQ